MKRFRIRIAGQSGTGLLSVGEILAKGLQSMGYHLCSDREYPSLIKGGHSCYTINVSDGPIFALSETVDVLLTIDKPSLLAYLDTLDDGGILIHGYERFSGIQKEIVAAQDRGVKVVHLPARTTAQEQGGNVLMANMVLVGMIWKALGLDYSVVKKEIEHKFASKPKLLALDLKCAEAGFNGVEPDFRDQTSEVSKKSSKLQFFAEVPPIAQKENNVFLDGNHALALGAVHAGVRVYYAYPMSPSSSILTHMAEMASQTGMVVKQAEDEITVANLTIGSMFAGTRALCATSGGGFDLMTETLSLAGILENPWVCVVVQRPGPATGLPTWTGQGDLLLAINSGHGEYARLVVSVSDPADAFYTIQHALNYAETFQIPVIVLSDKLVGESKTTLPKFEQNTIEIKRGLVTGKDLEKLENSDRFKITDSGISKRWIPGSSDAYYFANGDEHGEDGRLTEEAELSKEMYAKRCRKLETLKAELEEPELYGEKEADISFVGWGSTLCVMRDIIRIMGEKGIKVNYLHYRYVWPLKIETFQKFISQNKNVHLIEGNYTGQLGQLLEKETNVEFAGKLLKWNGRPFFVEDVEGYINQQATMGKKQ